MNNLETLTDTVSNGNFMELLDNYDPANPSEEFDLCTAYIQRTIAQCNLYMARLKEIQNEYTQKTGDITPKENSLFKTYYKQGYTRTSIDSKKLKEEQPDIVKKYSKTTEVKGGWVWELK